MLFNVLPVYNNKPNLATIDCTLKNGNEIIPGAAQIDLYFDHIKNKKIGIVANHSSRIADTHLLDTLLSLGMQVKVIFSPEHGYKGRTEAGAKINDGLDEQSKLSIISLYGSNKKPKREDLLGIDVLLFDLQDVGVRFYTYISTLHYVMEAASECKIELIVLDRPNPNGHYIDGPVLKSGFSSFVGLHKIPVVYGMTIGELAKMIKGECWISASKELDLTVIPCKNYNRKAPVQLSIPPSPNLKTSKSILLYPSLCFFEGTTVSVGRGTEFPFETYGHPKFPSGFSFTPKEMESAINPPWKDSVCYGIDLRLKPADQLFNERKIRLSYITEAYHWLKNSEFFLPNNFIDKLAGSNELRLQILSGMSEDEIRKTWTDELKAFKKIRKNYLLYKDFN